MLYLMYIVAVIRHSLIVFSREIERGLPTILPIIQVHTMEQRGERWRSKTSRPYLFSQSVRLVSIKFHQIPGRRILLLLLWICIPWMMIFRPRCHTLASHRHHHPWWWVCRQYGFDTWGVVWWGEGESQSLCVQYSIPPSSSWWWCSLRSFFSSSCSSLDEDKDNKPIYMQ